MELSFLGENNFQILSTMDPGVRVSEKCPLHIFRSFLSKRSTLIRVTILLPHRGSGIIRGAPTGAYLVSSTRFFDGVCSTLSHQMLQYSCPFGSVERSCSLVGGQPCLFYRFGFLCLSLWLSRSRVA